MPQTSRRLTALQQRFVAAYLRCGRAVAAARQAGYSAATATHSSGRLMRAPHIKEAIAAGHARQERRGERLRERVVQELERIAFDASDDDTRRPLDRLRALDLLGRMAERDLRRDQGSAPAATEKPAPADRPAWEDRPAWKEQFRRGMERVERGRRKDAERARREEAAQETEQVETTAFPDAPADQAVPKEETETGNTAVGKGAEENKVLEEESPDAKEPDWRERRAYLSRCYPLTHWPEEAAFYERMGRFAPT